MGKEKSKITQTSKTTIEEVTEDVSFDMVEESAVNDAVVEETATEVEVTDTEVDESIEVGVVESTPVDTKAVAPK